MLGWLAENWEILLLLAFVTVVFKLLPRVDVGHDQNYLNRRLI